MRNRIEISMTVAMDNIEENVHKAKRRKITDWLIVTKSHQNDGLATSLASNEATSIVSLGENSTRSRSKTNSSNIGESNLHEFHTVSNTKLNFTDKSNSYKDRRAGNLNVSKQSLETSTASPENAMLKTNRIFTPSKYQSNNKELHIKVRRLSKETLRKYVGNQHGKAPITHSKPASHSNSKSNLYESLKSDIPTPESAQGDVSMMPPKKHAIRTLSKTELSSNDKKIPREHNMCTRKNVEFSRKTSKTENRLDAYTAGKLCNTATNRDESIDTTDRSNKNESLESGIPKPGSDKCDVPKVSLDRNTILTRSKTKTLFTDETHPCDSTPANEDRLDANISDGSRDIASTQNEAIANTHESNLDIKIIAQPQFRINEIVWAKLGHFPSWPCKIERLYGIRNQMVEVLWFNDFRRSKMHVAMIYKFFDKFQEFSKDADLRVGLNRAIKEAIIYEASRRFNN